MVATLGLIGIAASHANTPYTISSAGDGIPTGAVIAFYTACPSGWATYTNAAGRVIVGAGSRQEQVLGTGGGWRTFNYGLGQTGGRTFVALTVDEIPPHTHSLKQGNDYGSAGKGSWPLQNAAVSGAVSNSTGGGKAFDNRPSYIALNYCYKL